MVSIRIDVKYTCQIHGNLFNSALVNFSGLDQGLNHVVMALAGIWNPAVQCNLYSTLSTTIP